jgi:MtrB/PioB family decaheme-associated outer membrane protein
MKHITIAVLFVALVFPVLAAGEDENKVSWRGPDVASQLAVPSSEFSPDFHIGEFTFGLSQRGSDTISSKFLEYRDIPQGAVAPFFRLQGKSGEYRYNLIGHDVTQKDQRYIGLFEGQSWKFNVDYTGIPHSFGNGGTSILIPADKTNDTEWRISDTLQESFQESIEGLAARNYVTVLPIVQPTLNTQPTNIDISLQRNRTNVGFSLLPAGSNFDVDVSYFHERRTGDRTNNGTSFGFNNVVETTEPIKYITQDFGVNANFRGDWGVAFAGFNVNQFSDRLDTFGWDNPFRAFDSTDPSAYQGPYSTVNGPKTGLMALPPSNEAWTIKGGSTFNLGEKTRASADLQFGQWSQNEQQFIPYTTNTAIVTPSGELATQAALPANTLDGAIDVFALNGFLTSRLTDAVRLNARYRFYDNDNQTPRLRFEEGYVRFDGVWEDIPRINVPFALDSNYFDVYGTWDAGNVLDFEVGYKWNRIGRAFRETENTTENTVRFAADLRFGGGTLVRALYELGSRDFDHYDAAEAEEHSFLVAGDPANQTVLRRYDQAKRDRDRLGLQLQWAPDSGIVNVGAAYYWNKDNYDDNPVPCDHATAADLAFCPGGNQVPLGLQEAEYKTFSLDVDVSPSEGTTFYGFYSREDIFNLQTGRQSGSTVSFDPAFGWSSQVDDTVDSIGGGANLALVPNRWLLDLFYRYQNVDGNNDFTAGTALKPTTPPEDIPEYDDTKLSFFSAQIRYLFATAWTVGLGGFWEDYELKDTQTGQVLNYMPGSFFINANNGDYNGWVGWLNLTYTF